MAMTNASQLKQLWPGLAALLGKDYAQYPANWSQIYEVIKSDKAWEESVFVKNLGLATRKVEGGGLTPDEGAGEVYTTRAVHEVWQMSFSITEEALEDNQYESIAKRYTKSAARSMAYTKELNSLYPLEQGFASYRTGDGAYLFSSSHTLGQFTNANKPTTGGDPNETYLENMYIQMQGWVDGRGLKISLQPKSIMIPPSYRFTMERLLKTQGRVGTSNNDINAIKNTGLIPSGYTVQPLLSDSTAWYVFTNCPDGMKHYWRRKLTTKEEYDFNTGNWKWKATERYIFTVEDPLSVWGCKVGV